MEFTVWKEDLPGINAIQERLFLDLIDSHNQRGNLAHRCQFAVDSVRTHGNLITDAEKRNAFCRQNPKLAALNLCTTVSKTIYCTMINEMDCGKSKAAQFDRHWIEMVETNVIGIDADTATYCWQKNHIAQVAPYIENPIYESWPRSEFGDDLSVINAFRKSNCQIALARDGNADFDTHSFIVALSETGALIMYDTYFSQWNGKDVSERFGPGRPRYLYELFIYTRI